MADIRIVRGLVQPLSPMGFDVSAGIQTSDGRRLYAIFERVSRRIMIVAHPVRNGNMTALALAPWSSPRAPFAGDLLDALVDPAHRAAVESAIALLRNGSL